MFVDIYTTNKKYNIIYADPPWHYKVWSKKGEGRSAESHYKTMEQQSIEALRGEIKHITDDNAILFIWTTFPCLLESLEVIKSWGFEYKTCRLLLDKDKQKKRNTFLGDGILDKSKRRNMSNSNKRKHQKSKQSSASDNYVANTGA